MAIIFTGTKCEIALSNSLLCVDSFCSQECKVSWPSLIGPNNSTSECTLTWSSHLKYIQWTDCQAFQEHFGFIKKYQPVWKQFIASNSIMFKDLILQHITLSPISPALQEVQVIISHINIPCITLSFDGFFYCFVRRKLFVLLHPFERRVSIRAEIKAAARLSVSVIHMVFKTSKACSV